MENPEQVIEIFEHPKLNEEQPSMNAPEYVERINKFIK